MMSNAIQVEKYFFSAIRLCVLGALISCDTPSGVKKPDVTPPMMSLDADTVDGDSDNDGLVDFGITWRRQDGVDVQRTSIRRIDGNNPPSSGNLYTLWRVMSTDSGMKVFERVPAVLSHGLVQLELTIQDTAGNQAVDTIEFELPHGKLIKTLATGRAADFTSQQRTLACFI